MKVIGKDRKAKQIDAKGSGESVKVFFDANLSMIKVPTGNKRHRPSRSIF